MVSRSLTTAFLLMGRGEESMALQMSDLRGSMAREGCQPYLDRGVPGAARSSSATSRLMVRGSEGGLAGNRPSAAFSGEAAAIFLGLVGKGMMGLC